MLNTKTAFITGSTSGIGYAVAKRLASAGAKVWLHGIESQEEGTLIAQKMAKEVNAKVNYVAGDLSKAEQTESMCKQVLTESAGIDILVNNAGVQHVASIENMPPFQWQRVMTINLSSAFYTMHAMIPFMQKNGFGRIINIASVHGLVASKNKAPYVASKFGMVGLTRVVALENADNGITANCICPGWVETALIETQICAHADKHGGNRTEGIRNLVAEKQPSLKMSSPSDIAEVVYFFCSAAAHNITGVSLPVDGGWSAQ